MNPFKTYLSILTILILMMLMALPVKAQEIQTSEPLPYPESIISIVPQYLIMNGIRVDYDKKIRDQHWLQIAPQFYLSEKSRPMTITYRNLITYSERVLTYIINTIQVPTVFFRTFTSAMEWPGNISTLNTMKRYSTIM